MACSLLFSLRSLPDDFPLRIRNAEGAGTLSGLTGVLPLFFIAMGIGELIQQDKAII